MTQLINLKGKRFGRLRVLRQIPERRGRDVMWECRCRCGKTRIVYGVNLRAGRTTSCGCYHRERCRTRDGAAVTREYFAWRHMILRCHDTGNQAYRHYGGRGIRVCAKWRRSFKAFLKDVGPRPSDKHSIDRYPDNNGDYEPSNVRWATMKEQGRNRRTSRFIVIGGERRTIAEWAEISGLSWSTIHNRLLRGWQNSRLLVARYSTALGTQ